MAEDLACLRDLVLASPALQRRLLAATGRRHFIEEAVRLAAEHGLEISPAEIDEEVAGRRRDWYSTWI